MPRKKHSVDQIIGKLRQAEVELSQGETVKAVKGDDVRLLASHESRDQALAARGTATMDSPKPPSSAPGGSLRARGCIHWRHAPPA